MSKAKVAVNMAPEDLDYLVHHVFLPPKLPAGDDESAAKMNGMLSTVLDALVDFEACISQDQLPAVASVTRMIRATIRVRIQDGVEIDESVLKASIQEMLNGKLESLAMHIVKQNAGVIMTRRSESIQLDLFELSPRNKDVMASPGRLRRYFPGVAIAIDIDDILIKTEFASVFSDMLSKLVSATTPDSQPKIRKAGQAHVEERDTRSPHHVTEFITAFLGPVTRPVKDTGIWKNTRDEIMWNNEFMPWRRSPLWLLLRVAIQLAFSRQSPQHCVDLYKVFMLYLSARILSIAKTTPLDSDYLEVLRLKVARRRLKLITAQESTKSPSGFKLPAPVLQFADGVLAGVVDELCQRRQQLSASLTPLNHLLQLKKLPLKDDVLHTLPELDHFLESIDGRKQVSTPTVFCDDDSLPMRPIDALPTIYSMGLSQKYVLFDLFSVEAWVANHLQEWIVKHMDKGDTCDKLSTLMVDYQSTADSSYRNNPEGESVAVLTIMELWVACDKSAISHNPLLREYNPHIPAHLLQSLVLPFRQEMVRLYEVEQYLNRRSSEARSELPYVFHSCGDSQSFAVRHYAQSQALQDLLARIENEATKSREKKKGELLRITAKYRSLEKKYERMECDEVIGTSKWGTSYTSHPRWCHRCKIRKQMKSLQIDVHEWPLPQKLLEAQSTVFELQLPKTFAAWRNATIFIQVQVLGCNYDSKGNLRQCQNDLRSYDGLSMYLAQSPGTCRIVLSSSTKPHRRTHRKTIKVNSCTTVGDVCLKNGMTYHFFDTKSSTQSDVWQRKVSDAMPRRCTYKSAVNALNKHLFRPSTSPDGLTSNHVIANQSQAPDHISVAEFKALCSLLSGNRLQWQNILLQLSMPEVDFRKTETCFALLQVMYQVGPGADDNTHGETQGVKTRQHLRQGHFSINDEKFCFKLISGLHHACERVKNNWESCQALSNFIAIAARVLTLSTWPAVHAKCLDFLSDTRHIAFAWLQKIRVDAQDAEEDFMQELMSKATEISLICLSTFDLEVHNLEKILANAKDTSVFIQACISTQECLQSPNSVSEPVVDLAVGRWRRLCHRALPLVTVAAEATENNPLNQAIQQYWPEYQPGKQWKLVSPGGYWINSQTAIIQDRSLPVHYNILTGELLVNGVSLTRIPREYEENPVFKLLFGKSILNVMPTNMPGMQVSVKGFISGHVVSLGLQGPGRQELIVSAECQGKDYGVRSVPWQLVPCRVFGQLLPVSFVKDHLHWYNPLTKTVEFRPISRQWTSSPLNWVLSKHGEKWKLKTVTHQLVSKGSQALKVVADLFNALEDIPFLHVSTCTDYSMLRIDLPRLQLGFSAEAGSGEVYSQQFRGMHIDPSQALETLTGLTSKLILTNRADDKRMILIPDGQVDYSLYKPALEKKASHIRVVVAKGSATRVHCYNIDDRLGRLVDNGNFRSKIYLAYLHALTSFCLPDKLTGYTGTEQALLILGSAAARSISSLSTTDGALLIEIASLTPVRQFYPKHLQEMQMVSWRPNLGFLSQHVLFYDKVKTLLQKADRQLDSSPRFVKELESSCGSHSLLTRRDMINCAWSRVPCFGAEAFSSSEDRLCPSRDRSRDESRLCATMGLSQAIFSDKALSMTTPHKSLVSRMWEIFVGTGSIYGPTYELPVNLSYSLIWLEDSECLLVRHWLGICKALSQHHGSFGPFQLMSWFSALEFNGGESTGLMIRVLLAIATNPAVASFALPPTETSYDLSAGKSLDTNFVDNIVAGSYYGYQQPSKAELTKLSDEETEDEAVARCVIEFQNNLESCSKFAVSYLLSQWPCKEPTAPTDSDFATLTTYLDVDKIRAALRPRWLKWYQNHQLYLYVGKLALAISHQTCDSSPLLLPRPLPALAPDNQKASIKGYVAARDLFARNTPPIVRADSRPVLCLALRMGQPCSTNAEQAPSPRVQSFMGDLKSSANTEFERKYCDDLDGSFRALLALDPVQRDSREDCLSTSHNRGLLQEYWRQCHAYFMAHFRSLLAALNSGEASDVALTNTPRICRRFFLAELSTSNWKSVPAQWKPALLEFALALHDLQRAQRLLRASSGSSVDFAKELQQSAHSNWSPIDYPHALLMEVESDITIRSVQFDIAKTMASPPDNRNSVMQLNMGEGKSSVIVPLVASLLADRSQLVRVIVAKPQSKQMLQMLVAKLGGLLDVPVLQLPFSRALQLDPSQVAGIANDLTGCMRTGGILLVQPEHLLSFKLMGLECLINDKGAVGRSLLEGQEFFNHSSRDIVDESDENFSVKFELVYTMGTQRPIDFSPDRWKLLQNLLDIVRSVAPLVAQSLPESLEIHCPHGNGSFPRLRIFKTDGQERLVHAIACRLCAAGLPGLSIARQNEKSRAALFVYLTKATLSPAEMDAVENVGQGGFWSETTKNPLLLLRGILAGGVLGFALAQKRWRVNYGLDATRQPPTRLAVPYRAKDSPSPRSEFSHPEVVLLLTSLSYYYGGLSDEDLFMSISHLLKSDMPDQEYDAWVADAPNVSPSFRHLEGVNIRDKPQCTKMLFPTLRYAKAAIDYFLGHLVFPKYIKEFPSKLSASGWDIGQVKTRPTSGFSGTNDARELLPPFVSQLDLESQKHTNALVLGYLLRDDNDVALIPPRATTSGSDADQLLNMLIQMPQEVQVLLDVGAQILELGNVEFARRWLCMHQRQGNAAAKQACVYFDEDDNLCVVDVNGKTELLQISPFVTALDVCLVFLDEAHTRGTDLKLPDHYRAAVTLGANLAKDRLVQACMRMRKLGKGQTVVFCIPPEIKVKILQRAHKEDDGSIELADVLHWAITETWIEIQRSIPLWAVQGRHFGHQKHLWDQWQHEKQSLSAMTVRQALKFQEDEAQTIEDLYRPGDRPIKPCCEEACGHEGASRIMEHCAHFGEVNFGSAVLQEEQERELAPEIEQERQVERRRDATAATHELNPALVNFARTGVLPCESTWFKPAFESLSLTSAAKLIPNLSEFPLGVLVTRDFARTIELKGAAKQDEYLRPVQWILTSTGGRDDDDLAVKHLVIISPFEAQALLGPIKEHAKTTMHIYAPRSTLSFESLEDLCLYTTPALPANWTVPRNLILQLNLFAGQLYISSFADYTALCDMLGLDWEGGKEGIQVCADGFIDPARNPGITVKHSFTSSPVNFLKLYLTKLRRDCQTIEKTHMGKILSAVILRPEDFFFD